MSRKFALLILVVLCVVAAGCAPIATPVGAPRSTDVPAAAATASVATTPGAGATLAGTVRYAGRPLGGARVELRPLGWATAGGVAVATAEADANGTFTLPNPPAGDWSVIGFFPDGEIDAGGWPPVSISPGQAVLGFVVPLERKMNLLEPIAGVTANTAPTFAWQPAADASSYRIWVIDAGATGPVVNQTVTGTQLAPGALESGRVYQWVVSALDAAGEVVATGSETFQVADVAATPPGPVGEGQPTQGGEMPRLPDAERAFAAARLALAARLGVDELAIRRVEVTPQQWSDACLGVARAGQMCAQVITSGWIVVMETGGRQYTAHTDQEGTQVRLVD
jgi:hypothetical protein